MLTTMIRYHTDCTEHLDLYWSHTIQTTESGHIARMGQKNAYEVSVQHPEQDRPLQELETDERALKCILRKQNLECIHLARDRDQWRAPVDTTINTRAGNQQMRLIECYYSVMTDRVLFVYLVPCQSTITASTQPNSSIPKHNSQHTAQQFHSKAQQPAHSTTVPFQSTTASTQHNSSLPKHNSQHKAQQFPSNNNDIPRRRNTFLTLLASLS